METYQTVCKLSDFRKKPVPRVTGRNTTALFGVEVPAEDVGAVQAIQTVLLLLTPHHGDVTDCYVKTTEAARDCVAHFRQVARSIPTARDGKIAACGESEND